MSKKFNQACPVARTLEVIGEKWTILVLRDLLTEGPCKFHDLEKSLSGIAPNTLSARLKSLQSNGIIESQLYSDHPPRAEYRLTEKGWNLGRVVAAMRDWGQRYKSEDAAAPRD